jgi:hypothetical protein
MYLPPSSKTVHLTHSIEGTKSYSCHQDRIAGFDGDCPIELMCHFSEPGR